MRENRHPRGRLAGEKRGPTVRDKLQPEAAEVESARTPADDARRRLRSSGLTNGEIEELADRFVALDRGESVSEFVQWALRAPRSS